MQGIYECRDVIKDKLKNNKDEVVKVLESLGCHHVLKNFGENEIRCALPDGKTSTSVSVLMNDYVNTTVFSRGDYDYKDKDIITFVRYILNCSFENALRWLCGVLDIEFNGEFVEIKQHPTIKVIDEVKRRDKPMEEIVHDILSPNFLNMFTRSYVKEWEEEGIPKEIQGKYNIHIDEKDMRWVIPIYDEFGNLVTCKGRTYMPNYDLLGIPKYWYYKRLGQGKNDILYGLNYHKEKIKEKKEIILFEGEKSVLKSESYGYDWTVSIGKNGINPNLVRKILSLHSDVVIAFDKDVPKSSIIKEVRKLTMFTNVSIIIDYDDLLDKKDSPVDKGKDVWEVLYKNRQRVR